MDPITQQFVEAFTTHIILKCAKELMEKGEMTAAKLLLDMDSKDMEAKKV